MRSLEFPYHFKFQSDKTNDRKKLESFLFIDTNKQTNKQMCWASQNIMVTYMYHLQVGVKSKRKSKVTMAMENIFNNNKKKPHK